jgi:histidine ammonia-lyase
MAGMDAQDIKKVVLGEKLDIEQFVAVARYGAKVEFSQAYCQRVNRSRRLVERWTDEGRVMYGVNTGFGALCTRVISAEETEELQKNILLSHAVSVGDPLSIEETRATMLMVLQNLGLGYSGVRLRVLEMYKEFLNRGLTPLAPGDGSVGYLAPEAHIALVLMGEGEAYVKGERMPAREALERVGLEPVTLSSKEGLALINGTTGATGIGALALYDMINAVKSADVVGAMSLEVLKGSLRAFDERLMRVRPHEEQGRTAENVRMILQDSEMARHYERYRLQDALSLRSMSQLHGAAKKTFFDALKTIETEMNSCCDNPILWPEGDDGEALSGGNPDSSYVGIEMDSACIAATAAAKMSERRNYRLINSRLSEYPDFLVKQAGLNSGLMIPQYTQAGLLNEMKILSHPATVDNIPTCADQEDYVAMGYNAAKKARQVVNKWEYILAIELLSVYQAHQFADPTLKPGRVSRAVLERVALWVPPLTRDLQLYPLIRVLRDFIHSGELVRLVEEKAGRRLS